MVHTERLGRPAGTGNFVFNLSHWIHIAQSGWKDRVNSIHFLAEKVQTGNGLMTICYLISNGCDAFVIPAHFLLIADGNTLKTGVIRIKGNCSRDPGGAI